MRLLVLGGTTESTELVRVLGAEHPAISLTTSYAGRTARPTAPSGQTRIGGFGGPSGLAHYLRRDHIDAVVDATHPFADVMPWNAAEACTAAGLPRLRLLRPEWTPQPGDDWHRVAQLADAPAALTRIGARRVFLTTGRTELEPFASMRETWFLLRAIEAPDPMPLTRAEVVLARGPFTVDGDVEIMRKHAIDAVVSKNSGGDATAAKVVAARTLELPVVMVDRPPNPDGPLAATVAAAVEWVTALRSPRR